jgi:hypothetical protein
MVTALRRQLQLTDARLTAVGYLFEILVCSLLLDLTSMFEGFDESCHGEYVHMCTTWYWYHGTYMVRTHVGRTYTILPCHNFLVHVYQVLY